MIDRSWFRPATRIVFLREVAAAGLVVAALSGPVMAQDAGWEAVILPDSAACDPEVRRAVARSIRTGVDRESRRGEFSIQPPRPVGAVTCLNNLVEQGVLIPSVRLRSISDWSNILSIVTGRLLREGDGLSRTLCHRAEGMFADLTRPLGNVFDPDLLPPGADLLLESTTTRINPGGAQGPESRSSHRNLWQDP